jgi:hypothetical protein
MRTTTLIGMVAAGAAMLACGAPQAQLAPPATTFKCTADTDCAVTVFVDTPSVGVCAVRISADQNYIEMRAKSLLIRWELDEAAVEAKYRFDRQTGIELKAADSDDQFYQKGAHGNGMQYHYRDRNTVSKTYDYTIHIVQKGTAVKCALDPHIINN